MTVSIGSEPTSNRHAIVIRLCLSYFEERVTPAEP